MKYSTVLTVGAALNALSLVHGHGALTVPRARNLNRDPTQKSSGDFQSGNGNGQDWPYNKLMAGYPNGSPCGDAGAWGYSHPSQAPDNGAEGWHYAGFGSEDAPLASTVTLDEPSTWGQYTPGGKMDVDLQITAYHGGMVGLTLCPVAKGAKDFDYRECGLFVEGATSPQFNTSSDYFLGQWALPTPFSGEPAMSCDGREKCDLSGQTYRKNFCPKCTADKDGGNYCGYKPGCTCDDPGTATCSVDGYSIHTIKDVVMPSADVVDPEHAVLVWHWITNNQGVGSTQTEQFMNCADMSGTGASLASLKSEVAGRLRGSQ